MNAQRRLRQRQLQDPKDVTAHKPFDAFMAGLDDPFARAYTASATPIVIGEIREGGSRELLHELAPAAVELYRAEQDAALQALISTLDGVDPLPVLCGMLWLTRFELWGSYFEPSAPPNQMDLELVAAIVAGRPLGLVRPASIDDVFRVAAAAEAVRWWVQALSLALRHLSGEDARSVARDTVLLRWIVLRGSTYVVHARTVAAGLATAGGTDRMRSLGCNIVDVFDTSDAIFLQWDQRVTGCMEAAWRRAEQDTGESPASIGTGSEAFGRHFSEGVLLLLPAAMTVPLAPAGQLLGPTRAAAERAVINAFGIRPGEAPSVTSVLVDPPQRTRPFLMLPASNGSPEEVALLADPTAFSTDLHLTVERRLAASVGSWSPIRAKAVNEIAVGILRRVLPRCEVLSNIFIDGAHGLEEVDAVILFEDIIIVLEGKGAPLSLAARRGGTDKLVAQLKELVGEGSRQLNRDAAYVLGTNPVRFYNERGHLVREIDSSRLRRCYQLLPCLDGMLDLGTSLPLLDDLGVLDPSAKPWLVGVTELALVAEILSAPAQFIGYIEFRLRWLRERRLLIIDETEMLSLFLYQVDLELRLANNPSATIFHPPTQSLFDAWYHGERGDGPVVSRPRVETTPRFRRFVDERQRHRPPGWLASCTAALQVPRTVASSVDELQVELALEASRDGITAREYETFSIIVTSEGMPWTDVPAEWLRQVTDSKPLALMLSQRGRRLVLEDVVYKPPNPL